MIGGCCARAAIGNMAATLPTSKLPTSNMNAYAYAPDRKHVRPAEHLAGFSGKLQVDGYGAYAELAEGGNVELAFCWSHVRRHFYEIQAATPAPIASEALVRSAALYAVESDIRGVTADERRRVRQLRTKPIIDALRPWLEAKLATVSGKSTIAEAIRYALSRWDGWRAVAFRLSSR